MYVDAYVYVAGFHAVDLDSASVNDLFIPSQVSQFNDRVSSCWSGFHSDLYVIPPQVHERKRTSKTLLSLFNRQSCGGSTEHA